MGILDRIKQPKVIEPQPMTGTINLGGQEQKMPQPPQPPQIDEDEARVLEEYRRQKAESQKKYTFQVCESCGAVYGKLSE
jgi:hypothetical protein